MSDAEEGLSNGEFLDIYDGSEEDEEEDARELDEEEEDPEDGGSSELDDDDDDDDMPEDPPEDAPGPSSAQPSNRDEEVPGISNLVVLALKAGYPSWTAERGNKRKQVWRDLLKQLRGFPENRFLLQSEWDLRGEAYLRWMRRYNRKMPKKAGFFAGPKWTVRNVVKHLKEARINEILQTEYGVTMGSRGMLGRYQDALTAAVKELSREEKHEMKKLAVEWNETAEPDSVKARFATRGLGPVMRQFAKQMWKRGGIRLVVLTGYKDEANDWLTTCFDFNREIENGPTFEDAKTLQGPWDRYIRRSFRNDADSDANSDDDEAEKIAVGPRPHKPSKNLDIESALLSVVRDDGGIWVPDLFGRNRLDLQALVRAYLTAHYRKVCRNQKTSVPFRRLAEFQDRLFLPKHLPDGFTFSGDPSHMKISEAKTFLQFIRDRQKTSPNDVFAFQHRISREGNLEDAEEVTDETDSDAPAPRGKAKSNSGKSGQSTGIQPSRPVHLPKAYGNIPRNPKDKDADDDDAEVAPVSDQGRPNGAVPRARRGAATPEPNRPRVENELPRFIEEDSTGPQGEKRSKSRKGKEVVRPKAAEGGRLATRNVPLPGEDGRTPEGDTSNGGAKASNVDQRQRSANVGPPIGDKRPSKRPIAQSEDTPLARETSGPSDIVGPGGKKAPAPSKERPRPSQISAPVLKVGPPIGAKRSKEVSKPNSLPKHNSASRDKVKTTPIQTGTNLAELGSDDEPTHRAYKEVPIVKGTASRSKIASAGHTVEGLPPVPLKSALKSSNSRRTDELGGRLGTLANTKPRNPHQSNSSHQGQSSRPTTDRESNGSPPTRSRPTPDEETHDLALLTPRRSNRERRAPARVDDELPNPKRQASSAPLTGQFKAKRARLD